MIVQKYAADYIEVFGMGQGDIQKFETFNTPEEAFAFLKALTSEEMTPPTFGFKPNEYGYMRPDDEEAYSRWRDANPNWYWSEYSMKFVRVGNLRPLYVHKIYVEE